MVDHIELYPNGWDFITGKGRLWVSAAEGFFFMSGLLIGMIYKRRLALGLKFIFKKMWTRALELYIVGVGLTFLFLAWAIFSGHGGIKDMPQPFDWGHYSIQALLMRYTFGWADFLVRFAILMFIAPFVFFLMTKRKWWLVLIIIVTAWLLRGNGFTLSWQLIFNGGIIIGYYWYEIERWFGLLVASRKRLIKRSLASLAAITFGISYASVFVLSGLFHLWGDNHLPHWWQHVAYVWGNWNFDIWRFADKWSLGPIRVALFLVWFPVLYWLVRRYEIKINKYSRGVIELLGRNSLFVYTLHAFIVLGFKLYLIPAKTNFIENFLITSSALALLIAITIVYKRLTPRLSVLNTRLYKSVLKAGGRA
jgi:hypothetical protein